MSLRTTRVLARALGPLLVLALGAAVLPTAPTQGARADSPPVPWPLPGSPPFPPDLTIPYLPAVRPICPGGDITCFLQLESILTRKTRQLGCSHDAVFSDAYVTITRALIRATTTPGFF